MEKKFPRIIFIYLFLHHGKTAPAVVLKLFNNLIAVLFKAFDHVVGALRNDTRCQQHGIFVHTSHGMKTSDLPLLPIKQAPARNYPHDVLLNAARIGKYLLCRPDATAHEVLQYAQEAGLTVLPVKQGYAKCNLCIVSDNAAITEDASIASALRGVGISVLQIAHGGVSLPPYPYGFIGGASGNDGTHVFFCGSLALHPDGARIAAFCAEHGRVAVSLADHPLYDVGSLLFFS